MTNELLENVGKEGQTFKVEFSFVFSRSVCRSRVPPSMGVVTPHTPSPHLRCSAKISYVRPM